jgi:hypothetical protein
MPERVALSAASLAGKKPEFELHQGKEKSHIVSFSDESKTETGSSAVPRTAGRPAEVLREGSSIKVGETAGDGLTVSTHIKDAY